MSQQHINLIENSNKIVFQGQFMTMQMLNQRRDILKEQEKVFQSTDMRIRNVSSMKRSRSTSIKVNQQFKENCLNRNLNDNVGRNENRKTSTNVSNKVIFNGQETHNSRTQFPRYAEFKIKAKSNSRIIEKNVISLQAGSHQDLQLQTNVSTLKQSKRREETVNGHNTMKGAGNEDNIVKVHQTNIDKPPLPYRLKNNKEAIIKKLLQKLYNFAYTKGLNDQLSFFDHERVPNQNLQSNQLIENMQEYNIDGERRKVDITNANENQLFQTKAQDTATFLQSQVQGNEPSSDSALSSINKVGQSQNSSDDRTLRVLKFKIDDILDKQDEKFESLAPVTQQMSQSRVNNIKPKNRIEIQSYGSQQLLQSLSRPRTQKVFVNSKDLAANDQTSKKLLQHQVDLKRKGQDENNDPNTRTSHIQEAKVAGYEKKLKQECQTFAPIKIPCSSNLTFKNDVQRKMIPNYRANYLKAQKAISNLQQANHTQVQSTFMVIGRQMNLQAIANSFNNICNDNQQLLLNSKGQMKQFMLFPKNVKPQSQNGLFSRNTKNRKVIRGQRFVDGEHDSINEWRSVLPQNMQKFRNPKQRSKS